MHTEQDDDDFIDDESGEIEECFGCGYMTCRCCIDCGAAPGTQHERGCLGALEPTSKVDSDESR